MKKVLFTLGVIALGISFTYGQYDPGTCESMNGCGNREITVNGLTQLYAVTGKYTLSADAGGANSAYTIDINKPSAGATVHKAYVMGVSTGFSGYSIPDGCVILNGSPILWGGTIASSITSYNHYSDVTALIASIMNPAPVGLTTLNVTECNYGALDGISLLVIFADPMTFQKTIVIMFGACSTTGDNFSLTLANPIDPLSAGALLDMGLGISFGFQPTGQYSRIDVNSQRLTTSAGGQDDGINGNGGLITVGGIGDVNTNPPNPLADGNSGVRYDDELYSLLPLITNTTTNILVNTLNPSNDDNIFLAYFEISGVAIIGEGILLTQELDTNFVGTEHTVMALVQNDLGAPVEGESVTFTVISGPNMGATETVLTGADGKAWFTYLGDGGPGIDEIEACFFDDAGAEICSNVLEKVWIGGEDVPISNWAIFIGIALIIGFAIFRFRK